jgi:thiol-disulfide isomerase/thioredoxin
MPDSIALGPLLLPTQAVLLVLAAAAALGVLALLPESERARRARAETRLFIALAIGVLGARAGWVVRHWQAYAESPGAVLAFRDGGYDPWIGLLTGAAVIALMAVRDAAAGSRRTGETRGESPVAVTPLDRLPAEPPSAGGAEPSQTPHHARAALELSRRQLLFAAGAGLLVLTSGQLLLDRSARLRTVPLPRFELLDLSGAPQRLPAAGGRPQVINLWASWCSPCRREMPAFARVQSQRADVDFVYLNIGESPAEIAAFTRTLSEPLAPILRDPEGTVAERLQVRGYPTTLILDGEGRLLHRRSGELSEASLKALLPPPG